MGLLIPVALPMAHIYVVQHGAASWVPLATAASVLDGSIFGDHCSPISDTTVMSSAATGCNHVAHVRTQLPYALLVAVVGMLVGDIPTAYGLSPWISLVLGSGILLAVLFFYGKPVGTPRRQGEAA